MPQNKNPIQERIEQERANSPVNDLTPKQIAQKVGELARKQGVQRPDVRAKISNTLQNSEAYKQGITTRDQSFRNDPEYQKAHLQRMQDLHQDPLWRENHRLGLEELRSDPKRWAEYQKNYNKGNRDKLQDPKYWEAYYKGIKKRDSDQEYHQRRLAASKEKIKQPVLTPLGVFETQTDATRAHGFTNTERVRHRCKSPNFPDWQLITVEEYQRLREK